MVGGPSTGTVSKRSMPVAASCPGPQALYRLVSHCERGHTPRAVGAMVVSPAL
jgi:hypothetical protein